MNKKLKKMQEKQQLGPTHNPPLWVLAAAPRGLACDAKGKV